MARILVADDHDAMREGMVLVLTRMGHEVLGREGRRGGIAAYRQEAADVVVTDLRMVPVDGIEVVRRLRAEDPDATVLVISAHGTIATAVDAMARGGHRLPGEAVLAGGPAGPGGEGGARSPGSGAVRGPDRGRAEALDADLLREHDPHGMVGELRGHAPRPGADPQGGADRRHRARAGASRAPARSSSPAPSTTPGRAGTAPFVSVSCAAIPEGLLESELFGHERGAFTGAVKRKLGRFELAQGGTLFLDEVGEIPPSIQVKLLRVLQERRIERVGGEGSIEVDVRLVSATNRELSRMVAEGRFREDLYYRLDVVPIRLPPLRDRPGDVEQLAAHFLARAAPRLGRKVRGFAPEALELLRRHRWPGNVRELQNLVEQALVFAEGDLVREVDLPEGLRRQPVAAALPAPAGEKSLPDVLDDLERQLVAGGVREGERREGRGGAAPRHQAFCALLQAREVRDRAGGAIGG